MPAVFNRRHFLGAALAAALPAALTSPLVRAADPVRLFVPLSPGGSMDLLARKVSQSLGPAVQVPFIIENRAGAGGNIAFQDVAQSAPDGKTLLITGSALVANVTLMPGLVHYDPIKSFAPIGTIATTPIVIVVAGNSPIKTWADFVARAKTRGVTVGTPGFGNDPHVDVLRLRQALGGDWRPIAFKGAAPAAVAALGGQTDAASGALPGVLPQLISGQLRALIVLQPHRSPLIPNVPGLLETGTQISYSPSWFGLLAPAGTPTAVTERLSASLHALSQQEDFRSQLNALGFEPARDSRPQAFAQQLLSDQANLPRLLALAGNQTDAGS